MFDSAKEKTYLVPAEQLDQRTEFGKTYAVGPGRYEAYQSAVQIHTKHGEKWQEIDARFLEKDGLFISRGPVITVTCAASEQNAFITLSDEKQHMLALSLEGALPVKPVIPEAEKIETENPAERSFLSVLQQAQGTLEFREIYPGVNLRCHTNGQMANTFEFASLEAAREITLCLSLGKLHARLNKDQSITLLEDRGETIYTLCPPALFDMAGQEGDVKVSLEEKADTIHICYTPDSRFMHSAVYPVTLDPVIKTENAVTSVVDTFVSSTSPTTNYSTHERIYASDNGSLIRHGFVRFTTLPQLSANHFITNAKIVLQSIIKPTATTAIYVREVTENWGPASVTYNAMPAWNTQIVQDYAKLYSDNQYTGTTRFEVTALARKWYQGTNYGVALTACEVKPCTGAFYSTDSSVSGKPYLQIEYASLAGLEDYLTYDASSAGKAGTGQVSLVNGNMIFLHQDTVTNGARMPVSVTHVYNSCDSDSNMFGCGYGWRTNFHQTLHKEYLDSKVYYVYTDGDGTEHWFKPTTTAATKFKDESGLSMELKPGTDSVTIRDKGDGVMTFPVISTTPTAANPVTGKVLISAITDACGNTITITASGMKISQIEDGSRLSGDSPAAGRITYFDYDSANEKLVAIRTPWQPDAQNDIPEVRFTYTDGRLTGIRYVDGNSSVYSYNDNVADLLTHHLLTHAAGPEGIVADFTYANTGVVSGLPHVVLTAKCWDGSSVIVGHTSYTYGANLCLVKDLLTNNSLRYHFNDYGNCTSVDDGLGYAVFAEYDRSGANADAPINHATSTSRIQQVVNNLLADGLQCKSIGTNWTKYGTGTIEQSYNGKGFGRYERKFTVTNGNTLYLRQAISVTAGKTYTLFGYTQSLGAKAYLRVTAGSQSFMSIPVELLGDETQTELERTQVTFAVPDSVTSIYCDLVAEGTARGTIAWWDSAQLEEGETANHVNLIENSQMNRTAGSGLPDCWIADSNCSSFLSWQTRSGCSVEMPENLPGNALHVAGRWNRSIRVYQNLHISGKAGDKLTAGGWCSSYAKRKDTTYSVFCRMQIWFCTSNSSSWTDWRYGGAVDFNHEEGNWQFACNSVSAPIDYYWVRVAIYYNRQMNYADFSNLFLYKEAYGSDYVYDAKGNRKSRTSAAGNTGKSTYDDYNNILTSASPGRTVKTTYVWGGTEAEKRKHLLQSAKSPLGTKTSYLYDAYGNATQVKIEDSTGSLNQFIQTTAVYTDVGTYVAAQTDARGKEVTTVTDPYRGTVTSVTDPKNQTVNSQYDTMRRLTRTSIMLTTTKEVWNENTYDTVTGYLTSITHNTTNAASGNVTYNFAYDTLGRQTSVAVGSNVLSTTYYDTIRRMVDHIAFANGGAVQYLYDHFSRLKGIRYDGAASDRFSYGYDAQGRVAYMIDHTRGVVVYTDYDLAGRPCRKTHLSGTAHAYTGMLTYNEYELPHEFKEYVGTARSRYTTGFGYDDENRITSLIYGTGSVGYTYDNLGRITKRRLQSGATAIDTTYTHFSGGHGSNSTTGLVQTITQGGVELTYSYDDCGNILSVSSGSEATSYVYDAVGQLIRVNDRTDKSSGATGTTWVYAYDLGGNILYKRRYAYLAPGTEPTDNPLESLVFTYGESNTSTDSRVMRSPWKDVLTSVAVEGTNEVSHIIYDKMGNPLNDGTWTYTWEHGRQLQQMSRTGETVCFEYNEDGLRTKKTATSTGTTEYTLHGKNIVHMTQGGHALHFYYDAQGKPSIVIYDGTAYGYLYNLQGDVVALVDGAGTKVVEYAYDAWGQPTGKTGTMASTLGKVQPFRYRGYVWDEETGLYYLRSRYYRPEWCRFLSADALIKGNLYCYCHNLPISYYDRNGNDDRYVTCEIDNDSYFRLVIMPGIMKYLENKKDYRYDSGLYREAEYNADGTLKKKGWTDCSHLMYEITGQVGSYTAPYRYGEVDESQKGRLFDANGDLCVDLVEGMEVYNKSTGHVGILLLYDFGNGLEWAVFQSTSEKKITKSEALFKTDANAGPNITSFYKKLRNKKTGKLESNWYFYTMPRFNEED